MPNCFSPDCDKVVSADTEPKDFQWIGTAEDLQSVCDHLEQELAEGRLDATYLDTEADSLHHFQEKLCLVQLSAGGGFYLIDTLAVPDLQRLLAILDATDIWLHGADYDLTLLKRTYGWTPRRIHDTQIAARLVGARAFGLAALVEQHSGVTLCKSSQKADWSQRPLPLKMQAYAVDDVRYLPHLAQLLVSQLTEQGRLSWFEQSCDYLRRDVLARQERDREDAWRISGSGRLRPKGLAVLRALWQWREGIARERDVPPFRVLNNQQMFTMVNDWETTGSITTPPRWRGRWLESFHAALDALRKSDPSTWPQRPHTSHRRSTEEQRARIERLCKYRDGQAETLGIESSLLGSRSLMEDLVLRGDEAAPARLMPWQREVLGEEILGEPQEGRLNL